MWLKKRERIFLDGVIDDEAKKKRKEGSYAGIDRTYCDDVFVYGLDPHTFENEDDLDYDNDCDCDFDDCDCDAW